MRILHTSDWHLGQHFYNKSRIQEHAEFFAWLLAQVDTHRIDAVIVAGDVFDTGTPPSYARALLNSLVVSFQKLGCQLVVLAGNHDSVSTLNESRQLMEYLNTRVIAGGDEGEQLLELTNDQGELLALLCAVPYLRPRDLVRSQAGESVSDKRQNLQQAIADHYRGLYERAAVLRAERELEIPIIATGHLTTLGATTSESVRDLYVGTLDAFPSDHFPPAEYIALGHIHRPQRVGGQEHIRYCGSPIPLSFDELGSDKSVLMVEFDGQRLASITPLPVPAFQPMAMVKGSLAEIEQQLQGFANASPERPVWLDIEVESDEYLNDLQQRVEALAEGLPVEVLLLRRARQLRAQALEQQQNETLAELSVQEVFQRRLQEELFDGELGAERRQRLQGLFDQVLSQLDDPDLEPESKPEAPAEFRDQAEPSHTEEAQS
ncbi:exonuclease subunit SbcD [Ferrimonas sediminicola]|uniref:Nuclease SbcCD subunit D n=1 Tax=Ferrimonas sediminicola TaxID=2569538 RepID=A0A4V5NYM1_9GAMM|nr:exonuclease subunit SbcD [Ferrimonas sediminicola]TKB50603.1 exonuclease subunit SbcD [Ferrimonas sediminicola]